MQTQKFSGAIRILQFGSDRRFYAWAALALALIAAAGFARSYYLKFLFHRPPLSPLIRVHGVVMTLWVVTFFTQTHLIANHRTDWHRRVGVFAAGLALLVVILGAYATVVALEREVRQHVIGGFHFLLGINFVNLLLFAGFVAAGLAYRRRPEFHKRLMLLATVSMVAPAVARIVLLFTHAPVPQFAALYACVLVFVVIDTIRHRRLHPAFGWGAVLIIGSFQGIYYIVQTTAWLNFVARLFP
jgi:hypothetical protein